ncbi:MAG TPA: FHA domain-containing protein [Kofleriaceae bacterium]|nr:FHA domain-containing protein [Kofleriaceae bacterium]
MLCDAHRKAITVGGLTPEQIASRVHAGDASLIDPWGVVWAVSDATSVGRSAQESDLTLLHSSVSSNHARLERAGGAWQVADRGSRNGTFVDGTRVETGSLHDGARVRFGEIELYFVDRELPRGRAPTGPGRTAPSRKDRLAFVAQFETHEGPAIQMTQRVEGGMVRQGERQADLARLEFALLRILAVSSREAESPDLAYLAWPSVAEKLEFRSHEADSENVRELVRRVRRKLQQAGLPDMIESRHGLGYRLAPVFKES